MTKPPGAHGTAAESCHLAGPPGRPWARAPAAIYPSGMQFNSANGQSGLAGPGQVQDMQAWRDPSPTAAGQQEAVPAQQAGAGGQGKKGWVVAAAGTAVTAIPAGPGLVLAASGHFQAAVPLLISSGVVGLISVIVTAAVKIHDSVQQTRRLRIQCEGTTVIAAAMARCIDGAHKAAESIPARERAAEAASVRAAAIQTVTELLPAMLAAVGQQPPSPMASATGANASRRAQP